MGLDPTRLATSLQLTGIDDSCTVVHERDQACNSRIVGGPNMKRLIVTALIIVAVSTAGLSDSASAYRSNNSKWTDSNYLEWTGLREGFITGISNNHLRGTSWRTYCNRMSWSGTTKIYAPGSAATTLIDYWSVGTPGDVSASVPAGVSIDAASKSATWETTIAGPRQAHSYKDYPVTFTVGYWFWSTNHTASSTRMVGSTSYRGPSFQRYEWVC